MQSGKPSSASSPPFATSSGKPQGQGSTASGGHNFLKDAKGGGPASGGRNFAKEMHPQTEAKPEVVPNPQEIPSGMGGHILKADPMSASKGLEGPGSAKGLEPPRTPFKGLR